MMLAAAATVPPPLRCCRRAATCRHLQPAQPRCPLPCLQADTGGRGVVALCGPTSRGTLVMGTTDGSICLLDSRK